MVEFMAFSATVSLQKDLFLKVNITLSDSVVYNPKEVILYEIYNLKSISFKIHLSLVIYHHLFTKCLLCAQHFARCCNTFITRMKRHRFCCDFIF